MKKTFLISLLLFGIIFKGAALEIIYPQFQGGKEKLDEYLKMNTSKNESFNESVSILFKVDTNGYVKQPLVGLSSNNAVCDSMALSIVKQMPQWIPGTIDNEPTEMSVSVSVVFGNKEKIQPDYSEKETNTYEIVSLDDIIEKEPVRIQEITLDSNEYDYLSDNDTKITISIADVRGSDYDDKKGIDIADLKEHKVIVEEKVEDKPFITVEQMPYFPGGEAELKKFIDNNLKYPVFAQEAGIQGRVIIRFVVEEDGSISNVNIIRGIDPSCDKEAFRLIKTSPKWNPGKQNGKAVRVYYTLPIIFKLDKISDNEK